MKFNQRLYRLPVSRRRVFNAMNIAINNNFERIASPQLERGQYKVKKINGFTKPEPYKRQEFILSDPSLSAFPGNTVVFYGPVPTLATPGSIDSPIASSPSLSGIPTDPNGTGSPGLSAGQNPGPGWRQRKACFIAVIVKILDNEIVSIITTLAFPKEKLLLNRLRRLYDLGKLKLDEGETNLVVEVHGWRRHKNKLPKNHPKVYGGGWMSEDPDTAKIEIYEGGDDPLAPPPPPGSED